MTLDDIQNTRTQLIITIPKTKTNVRRIFSVINETEGIMFLEIPLYVQIIFQKKIC